MKILITAGGTKVPMDDVRYVDNFSKGNFGARLAHAFLLIFHRKALKTAQLDHFKEINAAKCELEWRPPAGAAGGYSGTYIGNPYMSTEFFYYDEYAAGLKKLMQSNDYDIVFSAAAVSDFAPDKVEGKIDSEGGYSLHMKPLPKILPQLRTWAKEGGRKTDFLQVGFKLLSKVTEEKLIETAKSKGRAAGSDWTIANTIETVKDRQHHIFAVEDRGRERVYGYKVQTQEQVNSFVNAFLSMNGLEEYACA